MTERLPPGADHEELAEARLDEAARRGQLDPGAWKGRPLDLSDAGDPDWWIRRKLREEDDLPLPPALELRRDRDRLFARLDDLPSERAARAALEELDQRIRYAASHVIDGPPSTLLPLDVESLVVAWRERNPPQLPPPPAPPPPPRWWHRFRRS